MEVAIDAGVDMLAHLPGYALSAPTTDRDVELSDDLARRIAERGVTITPTLTQALALPDTVASAALIAHRRAVQRRNISLLLKDGARLAVGSDWYGGTARREVDQIRALHVWDDTGLLKLWIGTPPTIFPMRRIGTLAPGYEASFLVMRRNPLEDFDGALSSIAIRVKQGCVMR